MEEDLRERPLEGPRDGGAKEIRILARGPEKGLLPRFRPTTGASWASSKIISDSESFARSFVQASMYSDSFSRVRYECHRVRFLRAEPPPRCLPSPALAFPFFSFAWARFRARRINDRKSTDRHGGTERSRLIACHDEEEGEGGEEERRVRDRRLENRRPRDSYSASSASARFRRVAR